MDRDCLRKPCFHRAVSFKNIKDESLTGEV